uniref:LRAT domain-containing protein n=1 Tax=Davidia involucrata TaxID=16924 RepID=A0A5B7BVI9_DAVIN
MGLLSHRVERSEIVAGDHIYTWRGVFTYSHQGIYVGGSKVVHFTCEQNSGDSPLISWGPSSGSSSSWKLPLTTCPTFPDCGFGQPESGVVLSCLDCFLVNGSLYRFEYGVTPPVFLAKLRGGTCTTAESDPPEAVINRAMCLLRNGFGNYDMLKNNCEDFAMYCKTGLLISDQTALGRSGQAACVIGAPLAGLLYSSLKLFMSSPVGVVTATAGVYCMSRYATDIGVRTDIIKVPVDEMAFFHGWEQRNEEFAENNESSKVPNVLDAPPSKRPRCS